MNPGLGPKVRHAAAVISLCGAAGVCAAADDARQLALGKRLFIGEAVPACAVCHTLKDAGSEGAVGPVLDELKPDVDRIANALRNGVGNMPSYRASLNEEQIMAIAHYVASATRGAGTK